MGDLASPIGIETIEGFLCALSELSYRSGLGIGQDGVVFQMEPDDYERRYSLNEGDYLQFS